MFSFLAKIVKNHKLLSLHLPHTFSVWRTCKDKSSPNCLLLVIETLFLISCTQLHLHVQIAFHEQQILLENKPNMAPYLRFIYISSRSAVFPMLSTMPFSNRSVDEDYDKRSSLCSCGPIGDVGYPFWEDNIRPTFWGLHAFRVKCANNSYYPNIVLNNSGHYNVHTINMSSNTIVVVRDKNDTCQILHDQT